MITAKINFRCQLCGNTDKFYLMPLDEKTKSNDFIQSSCKFRIKCKECGKNYVMHFVVKSL